MHTVELARFVAGLQYEDLSPKTRDSAKQCLLDWLAVCIRGSLERPAIIMQELVERQGGHEEATVFARKPFRTTALLAALANGAASHALDNDDLHNASIIHLGTVVVPAALAVAEQINASGKDLITAIVAGYEVGARVGEAVNPGSYYFWHTTGTAGTFGAAAAAAKLLGLDTAQTAHCLGSAGAQAAGLWEFLKAGAMSKTLHAGKAAMNGILSAFLAKEGFTGATTILEGEKGFCLAMTPEAKLIKLTEGLGQGNYKIDENSFKPYACCRHCHSAVNASLLLCSDHQLSPEQIAEVVIKTNAMADNLVNNPEPKNSYGCKFSMQYCVAAAITFGRLSVSEFDSDKMSDATVQRLMRLIAIQVDRQLDEEFRLEPDKWSALVIITTTDGKEYQRFIEYPKGDPKNPMTHEDTTEKFRLLVSGAGYDADKIAALIALVSGMEQISAMSKVFFAEAVAASALQSIR